MKRALTLLAVLAATLFLLAIALLAVKGGVPVLMPEGTIGAAERDLMLHAMLLMLIVALPVYVLVILIIRKYRMRPDSTAAYTPDWEHSRFEEFVWWIIPLEIVMVLGAVTWGATHDLDPGKSLESKEAPYTVQVVALPWKWLFIYPDRNVASVNELALPAGRPVEFQITSDAPMNSFWIPALGGQMYAMAGMTTRLHLLAPTPGTYQGLSANYSGEGFGSMDFPVHVLSEEDFEDWEDSALTSPDTLSQESYDELKEPSSDEPVRYYGSISLGFGDILHESIGLQPD
jgi:cytochrome o ubiquinol oxidase subunit 2